VRLAEMRHGDPLCRGGRLVSGVRQDDARRIAYLEQNGFEPGTMDRACISTGEANTASRPLYESIGFDVVNRYLEYAKPGLTPPA
jgi:hypothetical protein